MYCPSQKRAPVGSAQSAVHSGAVAVAVQVVWHETSACTWQDALQLVWQLAEQSTEPDVPLQSTSQRFVQSVPQAVTQADSSEFPEQAV